MKNVIITVRPKNKKLKATLKRMSKAAKSTSFNAYLDELLTKHADRK